MKRIIIEGNKNLDNGITEVFPDRIEAATYVILGSLIGENLKITGLIKDHINAVLIKLKDTGVNLIESDNEVIVSKCNNLKSTNLKTQVYPGFPTDAQQPFTVLLTQAEGISKITETIYESRFVSAGLLNEMGANTNAVENVLTITGPTKLKGANLTIPDLRGGAALLLGGLIAEGTTILDNISLILRGYEDVVEKLQKVGAKIEIIE